MLKKLLNLTRSKQSEKHRRSRVARRRMRFEMLEDRKVMAAFSWTFGTDGDFNNPAAWTGPNNINAVPGPSDDASIPGGIEVTSAANNTVNSVSGGKLKITSGTFATTNSLVGSGIGGLTIESAGKLQVNGGLFLVVGSEIGGTIEVAPAATFNFRRGENDINPGASLIGNGTFLMSGDVFGGPQINLFADLTAPANFVLQNGNLTGPEDLIVNGTLQWSQGGAGGVAMMGTGKTIIQPGATLEITGGGVLLSGRTIENSGTINFGGNGNFQIGGGGVINNNAGANINILVDKSFDTNAGDSLGGFINNAGTIKKTGGTLDSYILSKLTSTGTIEVHTGNILTRSGKMNGVLKTTANTTLTIGSAGWVTEWEGTTNVQGSGSVNFGIGSQRSVNAGATINVPSTARLNWLAGEVVVPIDATMTINGNFTMNNSGDTVLRGGGTLRTQGDFSLSGSGNFYVAGDLATNSVPSKIDVASSRFLSFRGDSDILTSGAGGIITNAGVIRKLSGLGTSAIQIGLVNNFQVATSKGTLTLRDTTSNNGRYNASANTTIRLTDVGFAEFVETGTMSLLGPGTVGIGVGSVSSDADGASISIPLTSNFAWDSGYLGAAVGSTLVINGNLTTTGAGDRLLIGGGTVRVNGTLTHNSTGNFGMFNGGGSPTTLHIPSGSSFVFATDAVMGPGAANGALIHEGTIRKAGGVGNSTIGDIGLTSTGTFASDSGTLRIASPTGVVDGADFQINTGAIIDMTGNTTVSYTGTLTGTGAGELRLAGGEILVEGAGTGLTLNFPTGLFRWRGGNINTNGLDVNFNNRILMTGSNNVSISGGGTVTVNGIVDHQTFGNLELYPGSTLLIGPTGVYNLRTDGDITGSATVIVDGILRKNGGTGVSVVQPTIDNNNLVEVRTGTLQFTGTKADMVGTELIDGDWGVYGTTTLVSTLNLNTNVTSIGLGAKVIKSGPNSNLPSFANLASVTGQFQLAAGAVFANSGSLTNNGIISLSSTSVLDVSGNYSQTGTGRLNSSMVGTALGRLRTQGTVNLAGVLSVTHSGAQPAISSRLTLIENQSTSAIVGTFTGIPNLATVVINGMSFKLNYATGTGTNDAVLVRSA